MRTGIHAAGEALTAILLAAAILLGGVLASQRITGSVFYRQSKIIGSIFSSGQSPGVSGVVTDARSRGVLLKFAGALANAYVSFELIPVNEYATFTAVYESMGPSVEIERFSYHRRDLTITGSSPDESGYREFLRRLRAKGYFKNVTGGYYVAAGGNVRFEILCVASEY